MAKRIQVGGRIESKEVGGIVTGAAEILDDEKGKKQSVINGETDDELARLDQSKQDNLTFDNAPTEGSDNPVKSGGLYTAQQAILLAIAAINELIPSAASALNQLADKAFVNSSISTNTATFRGTSAAGLNEQQFLAWANGLEHDLNDYVFWQTSDAAGNTLFKRYKWNGTEWRYEYTLNNSTFTAEQWEAIQSGITALLVAKLRALPTAQELIQSFDSKQDVLTFDDVPTLGSTNPVKSSGIYNVIKAITDLIPAEATAQNQLADKADVAAKIVAAIPSWKGQYDALTDLQAVTGAKAGDMGCVKTTDSDGHAVLTFYQYSAQGAWVVYYTLRHYSQNKPATTGTTGDYPYNGMGRIELQKNIVDGVNTLTKSMMQATNTIYVIRYDFTLGEDITVPADCVLEFDGGNISGAYTITGNNTGINAKNIGIFGSEVLFEGGWNVIKVLANWFKASSDTLMFSKAIDFASVIFSNIVNNTNYVFPNIIVTCLNRSYTINDTLFVPISISFDGNGSVFNAGSGLDGKFMFRCNENTEGSQQTPSIPQNMTYIGNFEFFNTSYDTSIIHCADNRRVENILSRNANRILVYSFSYSDNRIIRNITRWGRLPGKTFDITSIDTARTTSDIYLYLGDNTILENLSDGITICAENCQVKMNRIINPSVYIQDCSSATMEDLHLENGVIKISGSEVVISNSLIYVNEGNINPIVAPWYNYKVPNITLKNVVFCNLGAFDGSKEISNWSPISGGCVMTFENVRGAIDLFSHRLMIKQDGHCINPKKYILSGGHALEDTLSVPKEISAPRFKSSMYNFQTAGTDAYVRLILLVDEKRGLYKPLPELSKYNVDQGIANGSVFSCVDLQGPLFSLIGCLIRIEAGSTSGNYTKFFDYGIIGYLTSSYNFSVDNGNYYFSKGNKSLKFSDINYSYAYTPIEEYTRNGEHVECVLTGNTLPDVNLFNVGDKCTTSSGKIYQKIGSAWVDATGATV